MRKLCAVVVSLVVTLLFCSCSNNTQSSGQTGTSNEVTSIVLSSEAIEIVEGGTFQMTYVVLPENAENKDISWQSMDETKATVNDSGVVTGMSIGQTSIIVTCEDGVYAVCSVSVIEKPAYDRLTDKERELVDALIKGIDSFYNPGSVTLKYAYYHNVTDSWAITVSAQNRMGGYTEEDYNLGRDGKLDRPILNHVRMPGTYFDLDLVNKAIQEHNN